MCDTLVVLGNKTRTGNTIFAKNSDREPNEAQAIIRIPAKNNSANFVKCTYISIPQVKTTNEVILSKPFQMWGAEMGANQHGLVIGNEAVFTKIGFAKKNDGLTGMDMLRLALERCNSAQNALNLITELIETYGQDACGGYSNKNFFYHNSFLIADKTEAWVLETADIHWVAQKVKDIRTISNGLTIGEDFDLQSKNLVDFARNKGWVKKGETFNFRKAYSDWFYTRFSYCKVRQSFTTDESKSKPSFYLADAVDILSSHQAENFKPSESMPYDVCAHASGLLSPSSSTGSMMVELRKDKPITVWLTGTSNPCLSVYKPFIFGGKSLLAEQFTSPSAQKDDSLWWQAETLHRKVNRNYTENKEKFDSERIALQNSYFEAEKNLIKNNLGIQELDQFSQSCLNEYSDKLLKWKQLINDNRINYFWNVPYRIFQSNRNKEVKIYS